MSESMIGIWGWDYTNYDWVKFRVDEDGYLQVAVASSALPTDAATETTLALVESAVDGLEGLLAGGLPSALDTDSLKVKEQGTPTVRCTGWDGAAWQSLLVEDDTNFNLRVKLYDGANAIAAWTWSWIGIAIGNPQLLGVAAIQYMSNSATGVGPVRAARYLGDNDPASYIPPAALWGFDGTNWDRLRTYGTGILKVGDALYGNIYSKTMTMADDNATRFEAAAKNLRDVVIIVKTNPMLLGETGVEVYPVGADETVGFTKVDISTLYFKNAGAGNNGVITILGVEE